MAVIRKTKGDACFLSSGFQVANTIDPLIDVRSVDLIGQGTALMRVNLGNKSGISYIPKEATSFKIWGHLFRAVGTHPPGGTDVSCCAFIDGAGVETFANFAMSTQPTIDGPTTNQLEHIGVVLEFPNIVRPDGNWGSFGWKIVGSTPLKAAVQLDLISYDVPSDYVFPGSFPARNTADASIMLYFGGDLLDSSPFAHPMLQYNSGLLSGGAFFDGTSSYQTITGSPSSFDFAGDFTIEMTIKTATRTASGPQRRLLSFGNAPSIGIWIDPAGGGIVCGNEFVAPLKTGTIPVDINRPIDLKWSREGSVNRLMINGYQDGPTFTDSTHWTIGATNPEIGRLNGSNSGYFSGQIYNVKIVNGAAI